MLNGATELVGDKSSLIIKLNWISKVLSLFM